MDMDITPGTTILEILSRYRHTEAIFRRYDTKACLLCHALFDTLEEAAAKYDLPLDTLLAELRSAAREKGGS